MLARMQHRGQTTFGTNGSPGVGLGRLELGAFAATDRRPLVALRQ